jgi:acetyl-CoA acyltransferase
MTAAFVYAAVRTAFGRYGGALAGVLRPDDLAAIVLNGLLDKAPSLDRAAIGDVAWATPASTYGSCGPPESSPP